MGVATQRIPPTSALIYEEKKSKPKVSSFQNVSKSPSVYVYVSELLSWNIIKMVMKTWHNRTLVFNPAATAAVERSRLQNQELHHRWKINQNSSVCELMQGYFQCTLPCFGAHGEHIEYNMMLFSITTSNLSSPKIYCMWYFGTLCINKD